MTVTNVSMLDLDLISWRLGLKPGPVYVGFVMENVILAHDYLGFSPTVYSTNVPYSFKDATKHRQVVVSLNDTFRKVIQTCYQ